MKLGKTKLSSSQKEIILFGQLDGKFKKTKPYTENKSKKKDVFFKKKKYFTSKQQIIHRKDTRKPCYNTGGSV